MFFHVRGIGEVDGANRDFSHVLINQSVTELARTHAEGNADVGDQEPEELAIEETKKTLVGRAYGIGGVENICA